MATGPDDQAPAPAGDEPLHAEEAAGDDETTPLVGESSDRAQNGDTENGDISAQGKRWHQQRWISFAVALILMAVVIVLLVLFGVYRSGRAMRAHALCLTPACIHAASEILYNLSPQHQEVDPCTDFDALVCDGWRSRHDLRPDQGSLSTFGVMGEDGSSLLRHILEAPYPGASGLSSFSSTTPAASSSHLDHDNFNDMQRAYNACMALDDIKKLGIAPVKAALAKVSELYPIDVAVPPTPPPGQPPSPPPTVPPNQDVATGLSDVILYFQQRGVDILESIGVGADDKNPDDVVIFLSPIFSVGLPAPSYYKDKDVLSQYQDAMTKVFAGIHASGAAFAKPSQAAAAVVALESQVAGLVPSLQDLQDVTKSYNVMSMRATSKLAPQLGLDGVIKALVPKDYKVKNLITSFPEYLTNISSILETTTRPTLQAFLSWKAIQSLSSAVEAEELKPYIQFSNVLQGKDPDATPERWRTCTAYVRGAVGWYLSRFYVEAAFSSKARDLGNQIVSDIKDQFISRLKTLDWMDDEVKTLAIEKVNKITQKIGYPTKSPDLMDPASLRDWYKGLNITDSYFDNVIFTREFAVEQEWSKLGKPVDRALWMMKAPDVNAYYNPAGNEIVFPAGIMQFPVFGSDLPSYINYGAFGAVAGHELSHAFDNNGRHYDVDGHYANWWSNDTIDAFDDRAQCFIEEYSNFTAPGANGETLHVNGRQTLGENIADAGGLSASYAVWQRRRGDAGGEFDRDLPGLSEYFSHEQIFYIAYGQFWCSKYTDAAQTRSILTDEHSPAWARIDGAAMLNSRGFREAFSCPKKEPVCELW